MENYNDVPEIGQSKYKNLFEVFRTLTYQRDDHVEGYQDVFLGFLQEKSKLDAEYREALMQEISEALCDPEFNWLTNGIEHKFIEYHIDIDDWPFQSSEAVQNYFKSICFDILFPEKALDDKSKELMFYTIIYLLYDIYTINKSSKTTLGAIVKQLRIMCKRWRHVEVYNLYFLIHHSDKFNYHGNIHTKGFIVSININRFNDWINNKHSPFATFEWPPLSLCEHYNKGEWVNLALDYQISLKRDGASVGKSTYSIQEKWEDFLSLPLEKYLEKYYKDLEGDEAYTWSGWMDNYINPCFDEKLRAAVLTKWGFVDVNMFELNKMYAIYTELTELHIFPDDINKFIGFMAGLHFFENISLEQWLNSRNWTLNIRLDTGEYPTLIELSKVKHGDNLIRSRLPIIGWWNSLR